MSIIYLPFLHKKNQQDQITKIARSWIGTKFHLQGRVCKSNLHSGGCDCIGLIMGIAKQLNLKAKNGKPFIKYDKFDYPLVSRNNRLQDEFDWLLNETTKIKVGDLILFAISKHPQHLAIISNIENEEIYIIHCHIKIGKVVEHRLDKEWKDKIIKIYEF